MNILIVDDEPINLLLMESLLSDKHETQTASNGQLAYDMITNHIPDIVLLDVLMPEMDGFETLKKIRENKQLNNVIVLMVTAKIEKEDVAEALRMGADDYIKKPVDATELYTKIKLHSKIRQLSKQVHNYRMFANISDSMISAQRIQSSLLPDKKDFYNLFPNSFTIYQPRDMVGGDLYFISENENKKFLCLSDSTGHGVPAAMLSMLTYMALNYIVNKLKISNPAEVANHLSRELTSNLNKSSDTYLVSFDLDAVFCEFDFERHILNYSNIRRPIIIVRENKDYILVNDEKIAPVMSKDDYHLFYLRGDLGIFGKYYIDHLNLRNNEIKIMEGDVVYMFSDGITDQFGGPRNKKFSKKRFLQLLLDCQGMSLGQQKLKIYQKLEKWSITLEQTDDMVMIGVKV